MRLALCLALVGAHLRGHFELSTFDDWASPSQFWLLLPCLILCDTLLFLIAQAVDTRQCKKSREIFF